MDSIKTVSIRDLIPTIQRSISNGGTVEMAVPGNSMKPTLINRVSVVRLTAITVPKRGDMVLYRRDNGTYVLHRIIKCSEDGTYVFCGDAQYQMEPGIRKDQMIAVVTAFSRREKWISCDDPVYRCWWRICVGLRGWRHIRSAVRRRMWKNPQEQ